MPEPPRLLNPPMLPIPMKVDPPDPGKVTGAGAAVVRNVSASPPDGAAPTRTRIGRTESRATRDNKRDATSGNKKTIGSGGHQDSQ